MPRHRAGSQLAIQAPPELLERLRAAAAAQRRTVTALVIEAIEAALSGSPPAAAPVPAQLLARVAALEVAVAQLQQPASPERVNPAPRAGEPERVEPLRVPLGPGQLEIIGARHLRPPEPEAASPERVEPIPRTGDPVPLPERRLTPTEATGLLTTPEVGQALGLSSDSALTNWIAREAGKHGSAVGGIYRGHRLRGKGLMPGGQKPGWLWEPVEA
jgi:hypothetical protein